MQSKKLEEALGAVIERGPVRQGVLIIAAGALALVAILSDIFSSSSKRRFLVDLKSGLMQSIVSVNLIVVFYGISDESA